MDYGPRECAICGKTFIPRAITQKTCGAPECVRKWKNRRDRTNKRAYKKKPKPVYVPKPDTIVAIGYADRQREATLKMIGKVRTEL